MLKKLKLTLRGSISFHNLFFIMICATEILEFKLDMLILNFIAKINSIEFIMQAICFHLMCYTAHFEISQQYFGLSISWYKQPKIQSSPLRTRNNTRNVFHLLFIMCVTRFDSSCHVVFIVSVFQELCSSLLY